MRNEVKSELRTNRWIPSIGKGAKYDKTDGEGTIDKKVQNVGLKLKRS